MVMYLDQMAYYQRMPKYTGPPLDAVLKNIPEGKILYDEQDCNVNWHQITKDRQPGPNAYDAYIASLINLEESICSK